MYTSEKEGSSRASWVTKEKRIEVGRAVGFVESGRVVVVVVLVCGLWFVGGWWVQVSQAGRTPLVAHGELDCGTRQKKDTLERY